MVSSVGLCSATVIVVRLCSFVGLILGVRVGCSLKLDSLWSQIKSLNFENHVGTIWYQNWRDLGNLIFFSSNRRDLGN